MRGRNRYGGYRGRRTGRDFLKYLIAALVVLVVVLAAILFFSPERPKQPEEPEVPEQSLPLEEEPGAAEPDEEPEPEPEPMPEPEPAAMAALGLELGQVLDGSWKSVLTEHGANALVLNMKPDDGSLNWDSDRNVQDSAEERVNDRLRALNSGEVYTIARMSCFRDELLANTYEYCIHSNSGYRWKDFGGMHWVSPASAGVQEHLVNLTVELAELGFDEILLDNCGYPQDGSGEMGWIKRGEVYDPENLDKVIGGFLEKLHAAVEPYGTVISIRTNAVVVQDVSGAKTGLTGGVLEEYADRIWISELDTDAPLAEILAEAGVSGVGERLVTQSATLLPGESWNRAVLSF